MPNSDGLKGRDSVYMSRVVRIPPELKVHRYDFSLGLKALENPETAHIMLQLIRARNLEKVDKTHLVQAKIGVCLDDSTLWTDLKTGNGTSYQAIAIAALVCAGRDRLARSYGQSSFLKAELDQLLRQNGGN